MFYFEYFRSKLEDALEDKQKKYDMLHKKADRMSKEIEEEKIRNENLNTIVATGRLEIESYKSKFVSLEGSRALDFAQAQEVMSGNVKKNQIAVGKTLLKEKLKLKTQEERDHLIEELELRNKRIQSLAEELQASGFLVKPSKKFSQPSSQSCEPLRDLFF